MYSKNSWSGSVDPFVLTRFDNSTLQGDTDAIVSFVIFEWQDEPLLGVYDMPGDLTVWALYQPSE